MMQRCKKSSLFYEFSTNFFQEKHKKITDEIYKFQKLHKLHTNIENEIISLKK